MKIESDKPATLPPPPAVSGRVLASLPLVCPIYGAGMRIAVFGSEAAPVQTPPYPDFRLPSGLR